MQIIDLLNQTGGLQSIASELGISEAQARSGAAELLPSILGGFKKQAQSQPAGAAGLGGLLAQLGGGGLLDDVLSPQPTNVKRGNDVLGEIFGSKDVSRTVAQGAASRTGLDASVLKRMLPMLAMLVAGTMSRQGEGSPASAPRSGGGGLGGLLGGLLGGRRAAPGGGASGWASMLDLDGDGNPLDDMLRMAGKLKR